MVGGPQDFSVSPSPLGTNWFFKLIWKRLGLGLGDLRTKGLGPGLGNIWTLMCPRYPVKIAAEATTISQSEASNRVT